MALSRQDAIRILRFCLGPDDTGLASTTDDGACAVTITLCLSSYEVHRFEAPTYEQALASAAAAGVMKTSCVEKQLAFFSRRPPVEPPLVATPATALASPADVVQAQEPFVELARTIGAVLHEAQRERGFSSLFVRSGGRLFADELGAQRARTDERRAALARLRERLGPAASPALARRWARAEALMTPLAALRVSVDSRSTGVPHIIATFSDMNAALLAALDASLITALQGTPRATGLAAVALFHAKEKTAIERVSLGAALLAGDVDDDERLFIAALVAARASYLHVFSTAAPGPAEQLMRRTLAAAPAVEVRRIEHQILSERRPPDIEAGVWFATVTRTIDALGDVGDVLLRLDPAAR